MLAPAADFAISGATTNGLIGTHDNLLAAAVRDTTGQYTLAWFGGAGLCLVVASASARIRGGQRVRRGADLVNGGLDALELHVFPPSASHDMCNFETYAKPLRFSTTEIKVLGKVSGYALLACTPAVRGQ